MPHFDRDSLAVLGVPFDNVTMDEAIEWMDDKIREGGFHQVATANVDFLMQAMEDEELQQILRNCDLVVPDGMPIVWAARMMGGLLKERVSGVDLVPRLAALAAERGYRLFLLGASEESSQRAARFLQNRYPRLVIAGRYSPPHRSLPEMDHDEILERIGAAQPDILLVAMGNPKQEKWIARHREHLQVPLCVGIGGSLDLLAGRVPRAPRWMQTSGLEWLHRVFQEPGRLTVRYLYDALGLALHLPRQLAITLLQPKNPTPSSFQVYDAESTMVAVIDGDADSHLLEQFRHFLEFSAGQRRHVVVDLTRLCRMGPEGLGMLARQSGLMSRRKLQFWLAATPAHFRRLLRASHLERALSLSPSVADALYRIEKAEGMLPVDLNAARSLHPEARKMAGIQVELLQDLCRRIGSVTQSVELALRGFRARTSTRRQESL